VIREILFKWFGIEKELCASCETLRLQLEIANYEKRQMLDTILSFTKPPEIRLPETKEIEPVIPKAVPWAVRRQMLEAEDKERARIMKQKQEEIAELEKQVGVDNG